MASSNIVRTAVTTFILACVSSSAFASTHIDAESVTASVDVKASGVHSYEVIPVKGLTAGKLQERTNVFDIKMHNDAPHGGFAVNPIDSDDTMTNGDSKITLHSSDMTWENGHWWVAATGDTTVAFNFASGEVLAPGTYKTTLSVDTYVD
ncbi:MyfA/PsaA family fimbrial adhesin [Salmonella enterica]|nr:MyfA/PsaA family fimbrial adhesin [Salmonella enterica]